VGHGGGDGGGGDGAVGAERAAQQEGNGFEDALADPFGGVEFGAGAIGCYRNVA